MSFSTDASSFEISLDPRRIDIDAVHAFLRTSYWAQAIPREIVAKSVANSLCVGAFSGGTQIGFARLVTDCATFGYLADVYVLSEHRGQGIAKRMLTTLMAHPDVQGLRRLMLVTRDAQRLYAECGFTALAAPDRHMEKTDPEIYRRAVKS
ncbi:MAG: Acetyltransferase (GNAT) family protein [Alphaproteobacteria bacterium ADurb.BinA280]|jgi:N-acetylglutamate synthase-like GNAT family acetyltransferase|nr:GNAT family N-acetyltransferase [Aquimonas sp.]OPZ13693.1 MAG: Acetyltransferase (GNAT) family protein [Alphaproteobacteria bacterium ADurb.BinA280]